MITVSYGKNIIDPDVQLIIDTVEGSSLLEVLNNFIIKTKEEDIRYIKVFIYLNGLKIPAEDWSTCSIIDGDRIDIIPYFGAVAAFFAFAPWMTNAWWLTPLLVAAVVTDVALGYLVYDYGRDYMNSLMDLDFDSSMSDDSNNYSWTGATTTNQEGIPIPIIYGKYQTGGNVISETLHGATSVLRVALGLSEGPVYSIDTTSYYINDTLRTGYDEARITTTAYLDGGLLPFSGTVSSYGFQLQKPENDEGTVSREVTLVIDGGSDTLGFLRWENEYDSSLRNPYDLAWPDPQVVADAFSSESWWSTVLRSQTEQTEFFVNLVVVGYHVPCIIRYRYTNGSTPYSSSWLSYGTTYLTFGYPDKTNAVSFINYSGARAYPNACSNPDFNNSDPVGYTSLVWVLTPESDRREGLWTLTNRNVYCTDLTDFENAYNSYGPTCSPTTIRKYDNLFVITTNGNWGAYGESNVRQENVTLSFPASPYADYPYVEVQIKNLDYFSHHTITVQNTSESTTPKYYEDLAMVTVEFDGATESLNGSVPTFKFPVEGISNVSVYNSSLVATQQWSSNPVWCLVDLLTNKRYGLGEWITTSNIDLTAAYEAATYCDSIDLGTVDGVPLHLECNLILDSNVDITEAIVAILETFNGMMFIGTNGKIKIIVDKPDDVVQVFTRATIIQDSLSYTYGSTKNEKNAYELRYSDRYAENLPYDQTALFISTGEVPVKEQSVSLKGITFKEQAVHVGSYKLKKALLCNQSVTFKTNYSAIACEPGDVIGIQDYMIDSSIGGKFISYSSTGSTVTAVLDQALSSSPVGYTLACSYLGDTQIDTTTTTISAWDSTTRSITFSAAEFPTTGEVSFIMYQSTSQLSKYRIVSIKQNVDDRNFEISGVKYDEQIYDSSTLTIVSEPPEINDGQAEAVVNFSVMLLSGGTSVAIWYQAPPDINYYTSRVEYRMGTGQWILATTAPYLSGYVIANLQLGISYDFRVVPINGSGVVNLAAAVYYNLTTTDSDYYPPDVTGLQIVGTYSNTYVGRDCNITWLPVSIPTGEPALLGYVIETLYNGSVVRRETTTTHFYTYTYSMNVEDNGTAQSQLTFRVYAENVDFRLSLNPAILSVQNLSAPYPTNLQADFSRSSCVVTWTAPTSVVVDHYEIQIYTEYNMAGTLLRSTVSYDTRYIYSLAYNFSDTLGAPDRTICIAVRTIDAFARASEWAYVNVENEVPTDVMPSARAVGVVGGVCAVWTASSDDNDIIGYNVYAAVGETVTIDDFSSYTNSTSITITSISNVNLSTGDEVHICIVPVDSLGPGAFPATEVVGVVLGLSLTDWTMDRPITSGIVYSVAGGQVSWTSGTITFGGSSFSITSGTTSDSYIYWDEGDTFFRTESTAPQLYSDLWVMAYFDGTEVSLPTSYKILHGGLIQASTITADKLYAEDLSSLRSRTGSLEVAAGSGYGGYIRGGQIDYATGTGFWMGCDMTTGQYKFSIGNDSNYLNFDGANLTLSGSLSIVGSVDWATQITGIPARFQDNPTITEALYLTPDFIGFYGDVDGTSDWRVSIDTKGNFVLKTSTDDASFRYYGEDSGDFREGDLIIGNIDTNDYFYWNQNQGLFSLSGSLYVADGGSINLTGTDSTSQTTGKLRWYSQDGSQGVESYITASGNRFILAGSSSTIDCHIGYSSVPILPELLPELGIEGLMHSSFVRFERIFLQAYRGIILDSRIYTGNNYFANACRVQQGVYTGNGSSLSIAIEFMPKYFKCWRYTGDENTCVSLERTLGMPSSYAVYTTNSSTTWQNGEIYFLLNQDMPGYTSSVVVGGRFANIDDQVYYYVCLG